MASTDRRHEVGTSSPRQREDFSLEEGRRIFSSDNGDDESYGVAPVVEDDYYDDDGDDGTNFLASVGDDDGRRSEKDIYHHRKALCLSFLSFSHHLP